MELALTLTADANNPIVGDLLLEGGTLVFTRDLAKCVAQRILVRLNFWRREYFLNLNAGTPYLEAVFEKGVPDNTIRAVFSALLLGTKGVASVDTLDFTITSDRTLELNFRLTLEDGSTFVSTTYGPFVISIAQ